MKKRVLVIAALVSGALAVSGCTTNPYTGEREAGKSGIGAGIGIGFATGKASEAIARQPEAAGKINSALLLGCALAEGTAIFGFITALLVIFMG